MGVLKHIHTILVCGGREYSDYGRILDFLKQFRDITVISGACRGADTLAVRAAKKLGFNFREYPANWARFGRAAGPSGIRP